MTRKSGYTTELGEAICEYLADGISLLAISKLGGMPPESTIRRWARKPEYSDQEFVANYARARIEGCDSQFDRLRVIEDKLLDTGFPDPQNARIAIDSIKWRLSKMIPDVYGERTHIEHSGSLKLETVKDHAPEWMQDALTKPTAEADEAETVH